VSNYDWTTEDGAYRHFYFAEQCEDTDSEVLALVIDCLTRLGDVGGYRVYVRFPLTIERGILSPESLETIEIELRPRPVLPVGSIQYDHLPIAADLCAASLAWAVEQLDPHGVSCDLWVSRIYFEDNIGQLTLRHVPADYIVNRVRMEPSLRTHEWFIECGDGRRVGSAPAEA